PTPISTLFPYTTLFRSARGCALLRLDRRAGEGARRDVLPAALPPAAGAEQVVEDQPRGGDAADRGRADAAAGAGGGRAREGGRSLGGGLRQPSERRRAGRPRARAAAEQKGARVLRHARQPEPLRDPLPDPGRETRRDARPADHPVRRAARPRRETTSRLSSASASSRSGSIVAW